MIGSSWAFSTIIFIMEHHAAFVQGCQKERTCMPKKAPTKNRERTCMLEIKRYYTLYVTMGGEVLLGFNLPPHFVREHSP